MIKTGDAASRQPTDEQQSVLDAAQGATDLAIEALAGTGKTTTLELLAKMNVNLRGTYVAFNKAIVEEASRRFPKSVDCRTAHSLAYRAVGYRYSSRQSEGVRMTYPQIASWLTAPQFHFKSDVADHVLEPANIAWHAEATVNNFCQSIDAELSSEHVREPVLLKHSNDSLLEFKALVLELAQKMWQDLQGTSGTLRFDHQHYLKLWQLTKPTIAADYILFDEAQDADPVMLDVVNSQSNAQLLYCGDRYQAIYEWRGAINALEMVNVDERRWLTQSFRFGDAIATQANIYLSALGSKKLVRGLSSQASRVGPVSNPHAVLCRTNAGVVSAILAEQSAGRKVAYVGRLQELISFVEQCEQLHQGGRSGHPELAPFRTWKAVQDYVEMYQSEAPNLAVMVNLVDRFGTQRLLQALRNVVGETVADVAVTTAHRAKGREWLDVKLHGDFPALKDMDPEDLRLAYVAVTRAQRVLDRTAWDGGASPMAVGQPVSTAPRVTKVRPPIDVSRIRKSR